MQLCLNCEQTFEYPFHGSVKVDIFCTIPVMNMQNWMQQNFRLKKKKKSTNSNKCKNNNKNNRMATVRFTAIHWKNC